MNLTIILMNNSPVEKSSEPLKPLLNSARKTSVEYVSAYQALFHFFGYSVSNDLPVAAISALGDGLPSNEGWWLRADPVECCVDAVYAYLIGSDHLQLTQDEVNHLIHDLNAFLREEGIRLLAPHPHRWYIHFKQNPEMTTTYIDQVKGLDIFKWLPQGSHEKKWRRLLTEIQMFLHQHSVNQQRTVLSKPLINSVWFWGLGQLPTSSNAAIWKKVWSDEPVGRGLAQLHNISHESLPTHFADIITSMLSSENYLIILDSLEKNNVDNGLLPLWQSIQKGVFQETTIYCHDGFIYKISPWRKKIIKVFKKFW